MNRNKFAIGLTIVLAAAVIVGFIGEDVGFGYWAVLLALILALVIWVGNRHIYIRVGEMETAVVFNQETRAFTRFLPPGRHMLLFPLERVTATVSTAPTVARGRCKNAQTQEGVSVDLEFSVTYEVFTGEIADHLQPMMARFLPSGATGFVRNHAANCVAQVVNHKTVEALCQQGVRSRLERELRESMQERLRPFGISVYRVMVINVDLPLQVRTALQDAHEHKVYADSEAQALERLHLVLSQFSDADVERLLQLRQLRELGQNGVAVQIPYLGNLGVRRNGGVDWTGNGRSSGDSPFNPPNRSDNRPGGRPYS